MIISKNGNVVQRYESIYNDRQIFIGIDSSKSNTAIVVGDPYGNIIDDFEISGAGNDVDVYQLCWDTRNALKTLFDGAKILAVGIENIITKNEKGYKGIEVHQSRAKITAVFDNLIFFFQEYHSIMPTLINNQSWKAATLPEEFRKRTHDKGSLDYFKSIGSKWGNRKDDVTDAVCIYTYLCQISTVRAIRPITEIHATDREYTWGYFPVNTTLPLSAMEFEFNEKFSIKQNMDTAVGYLSGKSKYGFMKMSIANIPLADIYSDALKRPCDKGCTELLLIMKRSEV